MIPKFSTSIYDLSFRLGLFEQIKAGVLWINYDTSLIIVKQC